MRRLFSIPFLVFLLAVLLASGTAEVRAQRQMLVTTTEWIFPIESFHCVAIDRPCPFSAAIELSQRAGGSGEVSACFDESNPRCLQKSDPNYDPATDTWTIKLGDEFSGFSVTGDGLVVDFTANIPGWSGPQDNRIAIEVDRNPTFEDLVQAFIITANDTQWSGFELRGSFQASAIVVRTTQPSDLAENNIFGPGLILAGYEQGEGIRMRGSGVQGNRIIGNWCGLHGDGTEVAGLKEYCIELAEGAHDNFIGGSEPGERNYFAGNLGAAIQIGDPASRNNVIEGNNFGTDATGLTAAPNLTGINVVRQAEGTKVYGNLISGNTNNGVLFEQTSTEFGRIITRVEDNWIGVDASGTKAMPNGACGIEIRGLSKNIEIKNNRIWNNKLCGISITGETARNNIITRNSITNNAGQAIQIARGANNGIEPPLIVDASTTRVHGTACPNCLVEIFSDPLREAKEFEGVTQALQDGTWEFVKPDGFALRVLTASATFEENTSALSNPKIVPAVQPTASPTIDPFATPTEPPTAGPSPTTGDTLTIVFLPYTSNRFIR